MLFFFLITYRNNEVLAKQSLILVACSTVMHTFSIHCHLLLRKIKMSLKPRIFQQQDCYNHDGLRI